MFFFHSFAVIFFLDVLQIFWGHITFLFLKVQIKKAKYDCFFLCFTNVIWELFYESTNQCVVPQQCQKSHDRLRANHVRPFPPPNQKTPLVCLVTEVAMFG